VKERTFVIKNPAGMHARPATKLVTLANHFKADVFIRYEDHQVNMKSVMGVLSLGIHGGSTITVRADGDDEEEALDAIEDLLRDFNMP